MPFFGSKGLTLIELMIVVLIIATLAGIATPSYVRFIKAARNGDVVKEIRMIERNIELYKEFYGEYPETLDMIGDVPKDPWGNEYLYLKIEGTPDKGPDKVTPGDMRHDHGTVPVNNDYDLYSMGADGDTKKPFTAKQSKDDIVRANNGEYVGLVSNY